tara:strand:- start:364 stop:525 length:162 start_codon:yes stop_codon:yes gene_type:complete
MKNGKTCNEALTVEAIESQGYTTRQRGGVLAVFNDGIVVAKGYKTKIDQFAAL